MKPSKTLLSILLITMTAMLFYCSSQASRRSSELGDTRPAKIAILDFYNQTGDASLDPLGISIADKLQGDLSFNFSVYDTSFVRSYVKRNEYSREDLFNTNIARTIGEDLGVDFIVRGSYNNLADEIMIIIRFTPISEGLPTYQFEYGMTQTDMFLDLSEIADRLQDETRVEIPAIAAEEEGEMEEAAEEAVSNPVKVEQIVDVFISGGDIDVGTPQEIPPSMVDYEEPSPRPAWVSQIPSDPNRVYFVGQCFDKDTYYKALEIAVEDAYLQMSQTIGTRVESSLAISEISGGRAGGEVNRQMTRDLLITTLSNVRNVRREQTYYAIKSINNKHSVSVLYSMERQVLEDLIAESVELQRAEREEEIALLQQELQYAQNEQEMRELERQMARLQEQMEGYQGLLNQQEQLVADLQQRNLRHQYQPAAETQPSQEQTTEQTTVLETQEEQEIEMASETYYPYSTEGWITFGVGSGVTAVGIALLGVTGSYDMDSEFDSYNPTSSEWDSAKDKADLYRGLEIGGWASLGTGAALMITGTILLLIEEDVPQDTVIHITPREDGATVGVSHRF